MSNYHVFKGTSIGLETIKLSSGEQLNVEDIIVKSEDNDFIISRLQQRRVNNLIIYLSLQSLLL